jgi:hypothetical protein
MSVSASASGSKNKPRKIQREAGSKQVVLFFDPEDGGEIFMRDIRCFSTGYTVIYPRK